MGWADGLRAGSDVAGNAIASFENTRLLYEKRAKEKQAREVGAQLQAKMQSMQNAQQVKAAEMKDFEMRSKVGEEVDEKEGKKLVLEYIDMENQRFASMNEAIMQTASSYGTNEFLQPVLGQMFEANTKQNQGVQDGFSKILMSNLQDEELDAAQERTDSTITGQKDLQTMEGGQKIAQLQEGGRQDRLTQAEGAKLGVGTGKGSVPKEINPIEIRRLAREEAQDTYGADWVKMTPDQKMGAVRAIERQMTQDFRRIADQMTLGPEEQPKAAEEGEPGESPEMTQLREQETTANKRVTELRKALGDVKRDDRDLRKADLNLVGRAASGPSGDPYAGRSIDIKGERESIRSEREGLTGDLDTTRAALEEAEAELVSVKKMREMRQREERRSTARELSQNQRSKAVKRPGE